jgi:hypothetical protein
MAALANFPTVSGFGLFEPAILDYDSHRNGLPDASLVM